MENEITLVYSVSATALIIIAVQAHSHDVRACFTRSSLIKTELNAVSVSYLSFSYVSHGLCVITFLILLLSIIMNKFKNLHNKKNSVGGGYPGTAAVSANNPYAQQSPSASRIPPSGSSLC